MIFLLVLLALFILYSFFFDKNNKSSYKKAGTEKQNIDPPGSCADRSFEGNRNRSRTDGKPPNLRRYAPESAACHEPDAPKRKK